MNGLVRTICFIGGADLYILKNCPRDRNKFIATGIGVLNTALLSMFTMGYAIYSITKQYEISVINNIEILKDVPLSIIQIALIIIFSVFWGFIIFGIDWGLISTIHKRSEYDIKSGSILVLTTLFRLSVAAVISFTVSKPIEVLVFKEYLPVARREMQVDYQTKLNANEVEKENKAKDDLNNADSELIKWSKEKDEKYKNDPIINRLQQEKDKLNTSYENLNERYKTLNSTSSLNIQSAQSSINALNNKINNIRLGQSKESIQEQQQIENLRSSINPFIIKREYERNEINKRNKELRDLNTSITSKQSEIDTRIIDIDKENQKITEQLINQKERLTTEKDSVETKVNIIYKKNKETANVFELNNLINNIIAIGYLEKWNNDPNANVGEREIAKKVIFVRWLLMILILIIDIAPIVIKLLIKRGCYEEEKENIEKEKRIRTRAHSIAYANIYPKEADTIAKFESKIKEIKALAKAKDEFNSTIDEMREKSIDDIDKMIKGFKKVDNPRIREILNDFQVKLENQLDNTKNKMFELYNNFITNIKS